MAITPNQYSLLIAAPMLQDYIVDKDTAEALSGGIVTFYKDDARTFLKNVYYQTGTPGNYSYIPLPNPLTLSAVGTIQNDGLDDVIPFFFPFDEDDTDIVETYYITVTSADLVPQFTRENFPFIVQSSSDTTQQTLINLIPNGQFIAHTDIPNNGLYPNGTTDVVVAQGGSAGWYYTKDNPSTDVDHVLFTQILQEPDDLTGNPRYAINIDNTSATGNDTFKELRMRFNNVNRFASDTQFYTFSFTGKSNSASTVDVFLKVIKNFGTSGSATQQTTIQGFTLASNAYTQYSVSFIFGTNSAATISPDDTDYVELAMVMPATTTFDIDMTDFILTPGFLTFNDYPERPDNMVFSNAISGSLPTPNADGSDLYLPLILTKAGCTYDHSIIGEIVANINPNSAPGGNLLLCDGSTYLTAGYSSLGIPYRRLRSVLASSVSLTSGIPMYGTGSTYATAYITNTSTQRMRISTNQGGAQTGAADGITATGFTFANIHTGQNIALKSYSNGLTSLIGFATTVGAVTDIAAATSGFTVSQLVNNALSYSSFTVTTIGAAFMVAGSFFTFSVPGTNYYCWFTIDGVGADPAPGGTGIRVNLLSTDDARDVSLCVMQSISGFQVSRVSYNAANTIPAGAYFTFNANAVTYAVWYEVNGAGSAPGVGTPIKVTLTGAETAAVVAALTFVAINDLYFGVPDFRGVFLRGLRGSGQFDINAATRFGILAGVFGNKLSTFELDTFQSHLHDLLGTHLFGAGINPNAFATQLYTALTTTFTPDNLEVLAQGSAETQPVNAAVNWFIRY